MNRKPTQLGIAAPAQVNRRPSGRYRVQAPDAPIGSVLLVETAVGSERLVEVIQSENGDRLFVGLDGELVVFVDWDFAPRADVDMFKFERQIANLTDIADTRGAAFLNTMIAFSSHERRELLEAVAEELLRREKPGKAQQVRAYL